MPTAKSTEIKQQARVSVSISQPRETIYHLLNTTNNDSMSLSSESGIWNTYLFTQCQ